MQSLGERIKYLREKKNITQKDLASKTRLTVVQLSRYETNDRKPDPDSLKMLADVLETTGDYLLGRTNDPSPPHDIDPKDIAEFEEFVNNPYHNIFFKDFLEAPEERKKELLQFWRFIKEAEKDRKPGDRQGE